MMMKRITKDDDEEEVKEKEKTYMERSEWIDADVRSMMSCRYLTGVRWVAIMKKMQPPLWVCEGKICSHLSCSAVTFLVSGVVRQVAIWVKITVILFIMIAHYKRLGNIHILTIATTKHWSMPICLFIKSPFEFNIVQKYICTAIRHLA